jgi:hypothetical protein
VEQVELVDLEVMVVKGVMHQMEMNLLLLELVVMEDLDQILETLEMVATQQTVVMQDLELI